MSNIEDSKIWYESKKMLETAKPPLCDALFQDSPIRIPQILDTDPTYTEGYQYCCERELNHQGDHMAFKGLAIASWPKI